MTTHPCVPETASLHQELAARFAVLGLPVWHCDASGTVREAPQAPAGLLPWLHAPALRQRLEAAARCAVEAGALLPTVALFPGCCLVPLTAPREGSRQQRALGLWAVLLLRPGVETTPEFAAIAAAAGLDLPAAQQAFRTDLPPVGLSVEQIATLGRATLDDLLRARQQKATLDQFSEKLLQTYEEADMLFRLARLLNGVAEPGQVMTMVCHHLHRVLPFQWIALRFRADTRDVPDLAGRLMVAGTLPCGQDLFDGQLADLLSQTQADSWTRLLTPGRHPLATLGGREVLLDPVTHDGRVIGALAAGGKLPPDQEVSSVEMQILDAAADFLGVFHENLSRFSEQRALFLGSLQALTAAIDAKDRYTCGHSARVALLTAQLGAASGWGQAQVEHCRIAGLIHDVGKIGVPEAVLCKAGRLTDDEFARIKLHPRIGHSILKDIPALADILPAVLHHHERWDGRGYPDGLAGERIPPMARFIALADAFDAMSSNRSYRAALPRPAVFAELQRCAGNQFDPALVPVFLGMDLSAFDALHAQQQARMEQAA